MIRQSRVGLVYERSRADYARAGLQQRRRLDWRLWCDELNWFSDSGYDTGAGPADRC